MMHPKTLWWAGVIVVVLFGSIVFGILEAYQLSQESKRLRTELRHAQEMQQQVLLEQELHRLIREEARKAVMSGASPFMVEPPEFDPRNHTFYVGEPK